MTPEEILRHHFNRIVKGYSYDNVVSVPGYIQEVLSASLSAMREYGEKQSPRWVKAEGKDMYNLWKKHWRDINGLPLSAGMAYTLFDRGETVEFLDESESPGSQEAVEWVEKVRMWHEKFGVNIGTQPGLIGVKRFDMRQNILQEEVDELKSAYEAAELHTVADAICDIMYVVLGTAVEFGLHKKLPALFAEVHRSNMSKLDENGNPVKREDGKILKSKLFSPPNLKEILSL